MEGTSPVEREPSIWLMIKKYKLIPLKIFFSHCLNIWQTLRLFPWNSCLFDFSFTFKPLCKTFITYLLQVHRGTNGNIIKGTFLSARGLSLDKDLGNHHNVEKGMDSNSNRSSGLLLSSHQHECFFARGKVWATWSDERTTRGLVLTMSAKPPVNLSPTCFKSFREWRKRVRQR